MTILDQLLEYAGGNKSLVARELGVARSHINYWEREGFIPEQYALDIEKTTAGEITAREVLLEAKSVRNPDWVSDID
jgi:DNA-binding transcriptional regulator YdaS (Cro superfamily)